jgi:hypothetical protein
MAESPAAPAGCWCATTRARTRLVTRIASGVVSLVAVLRGHERQATEELGQWRTHPPTGDREWMA